MSESDSLACTISNMMLHARGLLSEGTLKTTVWRNGTTVTGGTTVTAMQTHWPGRQLADILGTTVTGGTTVTAMQTHWLLRGDVHLSNELTAARGLTPLPCARDDSMRRRLKRLTSDCRSPRRADWNTARYKFASMAWASCLLANTAGDKYL